MKDLVVEKIDIVFSGNDASIFLNDEDFTDRVRNITINFVAKHKKDRIKIELHPEWWPEVKATFK